MLQHLPSKHIDRYGLLFLTPGGEKWYPFAKGLAYFIEMTPHAFSINGEEVAQGGCEVFVVIEGRMWSLWDTSLD